MKVAISSLSSRDDSLISKIKKILDDENIDSEIIKRSDKVMTSNVDIVITAGGDRAILDYSHYVKDFSVPVLGIYESDSTGFLLGQIDFSDLKKSIGRIKKGDYEIDNVSRLSVNVDGKEVEPVLNDISLFPRKSATLMEYILKINGNDIWHDNSDGVIISTPIGSTAYCMSAGGPMVLQRSQVFVIVPVNSMDNTRRPLIVPNTDRLEIEDILSRYLCEVILDGGKRVAVRKNIVCEKHEFPAKFVRLIKDSPMDIIAKKVKLAEDLLDMPPSAKLILKTLEYEGELSQKDLSKRTMLPERTIRLSLSHLIQRGYVRKKTSLRDARQKTYELNLKL
jgi:NAD+ kinase